ncbi:cytochrome C oxidase subunit IV family protein [Desulfogranum mediterraneum]|uniref:cytochrome C oxidase subunit IV family protein n=1 Tax=Desulfogranum mediterraneum TaxID=160661 RepID=UPI000423F702|nr:cytochrome C oxidase subunit IV family protein [Desulfogranum mediterraneum]
MDKHTSQHLMPYHTLALVLGTLLILTAVTVGVSYVDLGIFNVPIALTIAATKVSLVLLFFMHLKYEGKAIVVSFLGTIFFLAIMISFTFWDVAFR